MGRAATVKLELAISIVVVCLSGSTVLVIVIIVVKHRACLPVGWLIVGVQV